MNIHFIRNATLVVETNTQRILVDPMLGPVGSLPPYAFLRHRARLNPTAPLPPSTESALRGVTAGLITHCRRGHFDHLDGAGRKWLAQHGTPVYCSALDQPYLRRQGINTVPLRLDQPADFVGSGTIRAFETRHGYGLIGSLMGPGVGYLLTFADEPSLYISGDTVLTPTVKTVLATLRPDVTILAAGAASLDIGKPILMPIAEMLEFIRLSPGLVIATHLEALNHCPVTREQLRNAVAQAGLADKVRVPADGEIVAI
ncbi:MAG: MBL fold metallo-hydrolase [Anaerolineae bacterium]|nr:MBL fold metallo-hydrolase [Anaerolineae bacterium]